MSASQSKRYGRRHYTFREWCALKSISPRTGRRIIASGNGPKVTQLSENRISIREDHDAEWEESRVR
jgi:hypothetical protein